MTQTYKSLLAQREALSAQIEAARKEELSSAIKKARDLVAEFGLTSADVFPAGRVNANRGTKVAPKYKDPVSGATWTGRGKAPKWIEGQDRAQFEIAA